MIKELNEKNKKILKKYTFIDLFSGIGGFRIALESLGAKCVFSSEIDKYAKITYFTNFKEEPNGDITKINIDKIPNHDILCAGFPCQSFSIAGNQKGFDDSRGQLFFEIIRIVKVKKPKVIFLENVKNLLKHDKGNTFKKIKELLEEVGYDINYKLLSAKDYGVPQSRTRIYIVCFRKDLNIKNFIFPEEIELKTVVEDLLLSYTENKIELEQLYKRNRNIIIDEGKLNRYSNEVIRLGSIDGKESQGYRIYSPKGVGITLCSNGGGMFAKTGGYYIIDGVRSLHPRECARLMGFPDSFILPKEVSKTQQYKQFGNSVVVDVIQYISINIGGVLNGLSR